MKTYNTLRFEVQEGIARLTITRPKALNALNSEVLTELEQVLKEVTDKAEIRVLLITGEGEKAFVAGADIAEMLEKSPLEARRFAQHGQNVFARLEELPIPVLAAINGFALGGGCELAMACDIRIAAEHAKFGQPETGLGITPGFAGTQRLVRLVGAGRALELILSGATIDAAEAWRIGLVNKVAPKNQLLEAAMDLARKLAARSPVALELSKKAVYKGSETDFNTAQAYETEVFALCFAAPDQKEGMRAFLEKRQAKF